MLITLYFLELIKQLANNEIQLQTTAGKKQVIRTLFSPQFNNMSKHPFSTGQFRVALSTAVLFAYVVRMMLMLHCLNLLYKSAAVFNFQEAFNVLIFSLVKP